MCPALLAIESFNPRLRAGGDKSPDVCRWGRVFVSIHASAREATVNRRPQCNLADCFNPRLRAGGD